MTFSTNMRNIDLNAYEREPMAYFSKNILQGQINSPSHRSGKESVCFLPVILKLKKSSIPCQTLLDLVAENL